MGLTMMARKRPRKASRIRTMPLFALFLIVWCTQQHHGEAFSLKSFARKFSSTAPAIMTRQNVFCFDEMEASNAFSRRYRYPNDLRQSIATIKSPTARRRWPVRLAAIALLVSITWFPSRTAAWASDTAVAAAAATQPLLAAPSYSSTPVLYSVELMPHLPRRDELKITFRLLYAALVGSAVGWERSASKHSNGKNASAGIRTMALVSLGAAVFTICSAYGFGGRGDPSRMASNVASGVSFIGAGVITTHAYGDETGRLNIVSGLTTAAAIWMSAAIGVASGVGLYYVAATTAACTIGILRFGRDKRRRLRKRIFRNPGSSELHHDTSTWDEDPMAAPLPPKSHQHEGETKALKRRKPSSVIRIEKSLPFQAITMLKNKTPEEEVELLAELGSKTRGFGGRRVSSHGDDDVQPLP